MITTQDLTILILCAGRQTRFKANYPKQLAVFHDKPLLHRTIAQCNLKSAIPFVVTHNQHIVNFIDDYFAYIFRPYNDNTVCDTLLSTQDLWRGRTIVLLGDTYYTADTINRIWDCQQDLCVYSNSTEIFALSLVPHQEITYNLAIAAKTDYPKLWTFYRLYCGYHYDSDQLDNYTFKMIDDETGDIDTVEQYEHYKRMLNA